MEPVAGEERELQTKYSQQELGSWQTSIASSWGLWWQPRRRWGSGGMRGWRRRWWQAQDDFDWSSGHQRLQTVAPWFQQKCWAMLWLTWHYDADQASERISMILVVRATEGEEKNNREGDLTLFLEKIRVGVKTKITLYNICTLSMEFCYREKQWRKIFHHHLLHLQIKSDNPNSTQ